MSNLINFKGEENKHTMEKNLNEISKNNIKYKIIKENLDLKFINNKLWAHLHCYNINKFNEMYGEYINNIMKYFSIIVTYSIGNKIPNYEFTILKINNKGMDIGGKFCFINYTIKNKINYNFCLLLHSKNNNIIRKIYFKILKNLNLIIKKLNDDIGICTLNILVIENGWGRNNYHMKELIKIMNVPNVNIFPEGNIYILNKVVAEYMFDNRFNLYSKLNSSDDNSFDYSWFINYYKCKNLSIDKAYRKYKKEKLYGNNLSLGLGWDGLPDCMIEHSFERIIFGVCKLLKKKILINEYSDFENMNLNNKILNNGKLYKKPILLIACHSDNKNKIKYLIYNIKHFKKYFDTIYVINSNKFKNIIEPYIKDDKSFIINKNLTKEQLEIYINLFPESMFSESSNRLDAAKNFYKKHGYNILKHNRRFKDYMNYTNINFEYYENDNLICHKKWYNCLKKLNLGNNNFILTNDSYILINKIEPFLKFIHKNKEKEMIGLLDSNERKYHYPDFMKWYSSIGIKKWIIFFEKNKYKCKNFFDMVKKMEIESTFITNNKDCFYKMNKSYKGNIHFDDKTNEHYIKNLNYPVIKLKRLNFTIYNTNFFKSNKIRKLPNDFDAKIYKNMHADLVHFSDKDASQHFIDYGINEGRKYKKNQESIYPNFFKSNKIRKLPNDFDAKIYKNMHADLIHFSNKDASQHFINFGIDEGRKYKKNQESIYPNFINDLIKNIKI